VSSERRSGKNSAKHDYRIVMYFTEKFSQRSLPFIFFECLKISLLKKGDKMFLNFATKTTLQMMITRLLK